MARKHLLSHLAHVEIVTPHLEESVDFFTRLMGLEEVAREGNSVYLRCWGDYYHNSVILTKGPQPALSHMGWRADSAEAFELAAKLIVDSGQEGEWIEHAVGHGRAFRFRGPGGHTNELFWEVERYKASGDLVSTYPARPQRYTGRGVAPRQLDHVTVTSVDVMKDVAWYRDTLGFRFMEYTVPDENPDLILFAQITTNEKSHDLGILRDFSGIPGRVNHVAFFVPAREDVLRAAEVLLDAGIPIEYGPGQHGMGEQFYLYFREPGGLRIELNANGYRNYVPDWEPVKWVPSQGSNTMYRNASMVPSMAESFPPAPGGSFPEPTAMGEGNIVKPYAQRGRG